jgi:GxxExxY protein
MTKVEYPYLDLTSEVLDSAIKIHKKLGPGFNESVYQKALKIELSKKDIPFENEMEVFLIYDGIEFGRQRLDIVVDEKFILELKAVKGISEVHMAQIISYLKATGLKLGLILNFAKPKLEIKRVILS